MMTHLKRGSLKALSCLLALTMLFSLCCVFPATGTAEAVVHRPILLQNLAKWQNYTYGGGTLYTTGCGMFSIVNAVGWLTGNEMSITEVAAWGHSTGGFNPGSSADGTYRTTIYPLLEAKFGATYGFTVDCASDNTGYWSTSSSSTLKTHLMNGGVAIGHVPGHFIAVLEYDSSNGYYHIYDSYPTSARGTASTGGNTWVSTAALATNKLDLDWFCLLTATGSPINRDYGDTGYSVTFDSRGGSAVAAQNISDGALAKRPENPTRLGFDFAEWYDEDGYVFDFNSTPITRNRSLHAEWTPSVWTESTVYMPTADNTVVDSYPSGSSYVWPYYEANGSATMYKGGDETGWPSMTSTFQTGVDLSAYPHLEIVTQGNAMFNAVINILDDNGAIQSVKLSVADNGTENDYAPSGTITVDLENYLYAQNYALPDNHVVRIYSIKFFVVGTLDQFVSLRAVRFIEDSPASDGELDSTVLTVDNEKNLISRIAGHCTAGTVKGDLHHLSSLTVRMFDGDSELGEADIVKTGTRVCVYNGDTLVNTYLAAVDGDVTGDGEITTQDCRRILMYSFETSWTAAQCTAADVNHDGQISTSDARDMMRRLVG